MVRLGGTATIPHLEVFQGLETLFRRRGIEMDWVLYSDYDVMVDAFVAGEIDLAWNGPLGYVKIKRLLEEPCQVIAMRDVDIGFTTHFIARAGSGIETVEDLKGMKFAFGRRSSEQAGLVPHYLLKETGINPSKDLAVASFFEDRASQTRSDERDVVERVASGEFDAGSVSQRTMEAMAEDGSLPREQVRIFFSSPPYSHCCFTAQRELEPALAKEIEAAFLSVTGSDSVEEAVLKGEACNSFVPGIEVGWDLIEAAAVAEGLV
jgi:phosphate/phosphite/phosphonate ABC transporter binding protein